MSEEPVRGCEPVTLDSVDVPPCPPGPVIARSPSPASSATALTSAVKGSRGLGDDYRVLVTTELDLASRDADYVTMLEQLKLLGRLIERFMKRDVDDRAIGAEAAFGPTTPCRSRLPQPRLSRGCCR